MSVLQHYGVKGMKWGVRKDRSNSSSSKPQDSDRDAKAKVNAGRNRALKTVAVVGGVAVAAAASYVVARKLNKEFSPVNLSPGTAFQNINALGGNLDTKGRNTFVTFKNRDNKIYREKFVDEVLSRVGNQNAYATTLKNSQPIKAPSRSQTRKLFTEWVESQGRPKPKDIDKAIVNWNRGMMATGGSDGGFQTFLKDRGYNAMQDIMDQRSGKLNASVPLMVFSGSDALTTVGTEFVKSLLDR